MFIDAVPRTMVSQLLRRRPHFFCRAVRMVAGAGGAGATHEQGDAGPAQPTAGAYLWDLTNTFQVRNAFVTVF